MNNLVDLTKLTPHFNLSEGRLDVLDLNNEVVLKLTLVSKEFNDHFDILDQNENASVEVGYFNIYLPIASSWAVPQHGRAKKIDSDTPQEVIDVANYFLAGGVDEGSLRRDLTGLALYVPSNVDIEIESLLVAASFEYPAEYVSHNVSLDVDGSDLVSSQLSEDPEQIINFVNDYYEVDDSEALLEGLLASVRTF